MSICSICHQNQSLPHNSTCHDCGLRIAYIRCIHDDGIWRCTKEMPCHVCDSIVKRCAFNGNNKPKYIGVLPYCDYPRDPRDLDGHVVMVCNNDKTNTYSYLKLPITHPCYVIAAKMIIWSMFGIFVPYANIEKQIFHPDKETILFAIHLDTTEYDDIKERIDFFGGMIKEPVHIIFAHISDRFFGVIHYPRIGQQPMPNEIKITIQTINIAKYINSQMKN